MWEPSAFRDLVSGQKRGVGASLLRTALGAAEIPYAWAMRRRNRRYDARRAAVHRVDAAVISVGNLTLGGVGKTPMVLWLAQWLSARSIPLAIVSRGYGARGEANDEARELAQRLPGVPHLQNPDRVAAAQEAIRRHAVRAIVLDDAFQHRRIARDLDIVLLDAFEPFGFGHVFPRGTLREPLEGLRRADLVALSRADALQPHDRAALRTQVAEIAPHAAWLELCTRRKISWRQAASGRRWNRSKTGGLSAFADWGIPPASDAPSKKAVGGSSIFASSPTTTPTRRETWTVWPIGPGGIGRRPSSAHGRTW